jgi:sugar phosphate isomerase/epimerase
MKLGANSVLFGGYDMEVAFKYLKWAGYDGIEISAIGGMSNHLVLDRWQDCAPRIKELAKRYDLALLAMEQPSQDPAVMEKAMQAAVETGIPIINCGPGGKSNDETTFQQTVDSLGKLADRAAHYGITLCVKAHVGAAVYNTPTTLRLLKAVTSPAFGLDMDPSHIYRAGEDPVEALRQVVNRIRHVHVRDCKGRQQSRDRPSCRPTVGATSISWPTCACCTRRVTRGRLTWRSLARRTIRRTGAR